MSAVVLGRSSDATRPVRHPGVFRSRADEVVELSP